MRAEERLQPLHPVVLHPRDGDDRVDRAQGDRVIIGEGRACVGDQRLLDPTALEHRTAGRMVLRQTRLLPALVRRVGGEHRLDRRHAADGLVEEAPAVGDRADELAAHVDRAAAHAADDPRLALDHGAGGDLDEDQVLAEVGLGEDTEHLDVEARDLHALED